MNLLCRLLPALALPITLLAAAPAPPPRLFGSPTPAAAAVSVPEASLLEAISDDGGWLLFTSAGDRWVTNDLNAATDVFLADRTTGRVTLISTTPAGCPGNGTSVAGGMSEDASRVVFLSRASDLVPEDGNGTWDVFVREMATGAIALASVAAQGGSSTGPALDPVISRDGRHVLFRSPATDLASGGVLAAHNLYRRDLEGRLTDCLTTNLPPGFDGVWRHTDYVATRDPVAIGMTVGCVSTSRLPAAVWYDLVSGVVTTCAPTLVPELVGARGPSVPAVSGDGTRVTLRSELSLSGGITRYGLTLHDPRQGTATLLSLRTNLVPIHSLSVPAAAFTASLSYDGAAVAYIAPWPGDPTAPAESRTNGPFQVYLYMAGSRVTTLLSAAPNGTTPADADAMTPAMAPDGRGVAFWSRATNLLPGLTNPVLRAYWFDPAAGALTLVAESPGQHTSPPPLVFSPNSDWLATTSPGDGGATTFHLFDTRTHSSDPVTLAPSVTMSSTARSWLWLRPEGVSADGRYVAFGAFPPAPAGDTNYVQVYRLDTWDGGRQLLTQGLDGHLANGHSGTPLIRADGSEVLFVSSASNLLEDDTNNVTDVVVHTVSTGQRQPLRPDSTPLSARAATEALLGPDGGYALVGFYPVPPITAPIRIAWRLVDRSSGAVSSPIAGIMVDLPRFSPAGHHVVLSRATTSWARVEVEVHDCAISIASTESTAPPRWTSASRARLPVLSGDGARVAFFHTPPVATASNAIVVVDWSRNQILLSNLVVRAAISPPALSSDGRQVAWLARGPTVTNVDQVWLAELDTGTVALVSVGADGSREANGDSKSVALSADGRYVAFASLADNLVPGDTNGTQDVFLRDMVTEQTLLVSRTPGGAPGAGWSLQPFFSADGRSLFFLSDAPDLAPGDYNQAVDLFKVELVTDSGLLLVIQRNLTTGQAQLLWNAAAGKAYAVDFKDDLAAAWTRLPGEFTGDAPVEVHTAASGRRFFRVLELP